MKKIIQVLTLISALSLATLTSFSQITTKTVGSSGDYATLYEAFSDITIGTLTGDIVFNIISDITETATSSVWAGSEACNYSSITIQPSGGSRTISANMTSPILSIYGSGSNITIDGRIGGTGSENQLTLNNTSGSVFYIYSHSGVDNITIQYTNISSNGNETIRLHADDYTITNLLIDNCNIGSEIAAATNGISSNCTGTGNITATVSNCNIYNFWNASSSSKGIFLDQGSESWTISNNNFYQTVTRTATAGNTHYGIYINEGDGHTITGNHIGGSEAQCGGLPWTINGDYANKFVGINLNVGSTTPTSVNGNVVGNFNHTYHSTTNATHLPGIWTGIYLLGGNANIGNDTGNTIGTNTGTNNIEVNSTAAANVATYGIGINSTGSTVDINNNQVCGFTLNASSLTNGHSFIGIQNSAATEITIA